MEGYAYSYPDSGDSSPRSREIDFENPPPSWEDQPPPPNHKVKFLVSYGGKIQPRTHDNLLSYVGGETKILAVDRSIKFSPFLSKLSSLISEDSSSSSPAPPLSSFKYQLPGEDLDALISVTNDDDLEHMMHEYDRLYRGSSKPARLRLFAFPGSGQSSGFGSGCSEPGKLDRDRFVEALNPVPDQVPVPGSHHGNVDFLFGLDNRGPVHVVKDQDPVHYPDRVIVSDPQIDARIQELNRLQISAQEQQQPPAAIYRPKNEDNLVGAFPGDAYQKPPPTIPASVQVPVSYWQHPMPQSAVGLEHPRPQQQMPPPTHQQQSVYMVHAPPPSNVFHPQGVRPVVGQPPQGYYQMQRVPSDPYREQPVYNVGPPQPQQLSGPQPPAPTMAAPAKLAGYSEGVGAPVRQATGMAENTGGYQVAYDSATGRQIYYAATGGAGMGVVTTPFQAVGAATVSGEVIPPAGGLTSSKGKVVTKVSPSSAGV